MPTWARAFTGATTAVLLLGAVVILARSGDSDSKEGDGLQSSAPQAEVRGCQRVEGVPRITPTGAGDTLIGPVAFIGLPITYRDYASRTDIEPDPNLPVTGMKSIAWVRAGVRASLTVPTEQRPWMRLLYEQPQRTGTRAIELRACRTRESRRAHWRECGWRPRKACGSRRYTEFNGGIGIDFENAPQRGLCADLIVRINGEQQPLRKRLFQPGPGQCTPSAD